MVSAFRVQITLHGRDGECRAIRRLLDGPDGGALLLHGEPGSGRGAVLAYARRHAGERAVLAAAGLADEATLPYAGLQRLLDPVLDRAGSLPDPQRRVLRRALAGGGCPAARRLALATAVLALLAAAARDRPLLCTMDDVDAGDPETGETLAVVARRCTGCRSHSWSPRAARRRPTASRPTGCPRWTRSSARRCSPTGGPGRRRPRWPPTWRRSAAATRRRLSTSPTRSPPASGTGRSRCPPPRRPTGRSAPPTGPASTGFPRTPAGCCCSPRSTPTGTRPPWPAPRAPPGWPWRRSRRPRPPACCAPARRA
ncbi:ATP-binding protein [Micromonospora chersina]|uniref:ATP-binding protein n=1 Tax=Micromonospora chersina TaxID=47854 RepID=UPI003455B557